MRKPTAALDAEYLKEIDKARRELRALISAKNCAPHMLRLAWHAAGTYDAHTKTGDPYGSIKDEVESNRVAYNRLKKAVDFCEEVKKTCPKITYADLYQVAGVVAVEVTGGPTIDFVPGRMDSQGTPTQGCLPEANHGAQPSMEVFHRMGLSDKDIVALCGGYTLREAHDETSRSESQCTSKPLKFDNSYFKELLSSGKAPWQSVSIGKARVSLPTDQALLKDREFRKFVEIYANDEDAFFKDYAASHKKLSELGFERKLSVDVVHGIIGVFLASTVAILGYLIQLTEESSEAIIIY